jgi:hypothetical protein
MGRRSNWLVILCFAGIFAVLSATLGPDFVGALGSYTWKKTPCVIVRSEVGEEAFSRSVMHFVLKVEYQYTFKGRDYLGNRYTTGKRQGSTDISKAEQAALRFPPGAAAICLVNPRNPEEAVLERGELWGGIFLLTPFFLYVLVAHESIFAWIAERRLKARRRRDIPLSETNDALRTDGRHIFFGFLGTAIGLAFFVFCVLLPAWRWADSRNWIEREATIIRSEVSRESSSHGPTYSLKLTFEYEFRGKTMHSDQKDFGELGSVADISDWVSSHPAGTRTVCFVNPQKPAQAVLERHFDVGWIWVGFGALMLGFGLYMFHQCWKTIALRKRLEGAELAKFSLGEIWEETSRLRVFPTPLWIAIAAAAGSVVLGYAGGWSAWKGLVAFRYGRLDTINLLYGAVAIAGAAWMGTRSAKFFRRSRLPLPVIRVTPGAPRLGEPFLLEWELTSSNRHPYARICLEAAEESTIREITAGMHGAASEEKTVRSVFWSKELLQIKEFERGGTLRYRIPPTAMHSFRGVKYAIQWKIKVVFPVNGSPPVEYSFPIVVQPPN